LGKCYVTPLEGSIMIPGSINEARITIKAIIVLDFESLQSISGSFYRKESLIR